MIKKNILAITNCEREIIDQERPSTRYDPFSLVNDHAFPYICQLFINENNLMTKILLSKIVIPYSKLFQTQS